MLFCVSVKSFAPDIFHDEIGQSVISGSAIEQAGDVGMFERRKNLPLVLKTIQDRLGVHPALDQLDRDDHSELLIGAFGQVDIAHASSADALEQPVPTNG